MQAKPSGAKRKSHGDGAEVQGPKLVAPAREAAFGVLLRVERGSEHSDELLHSAAVSRLSRPDRDLCTALVMGVLRWQIAMDAVIRPLLARPDQRLAPEVLLPLRLGIFQLRYLDRIPPHAALSESVELCRAAGQPHAAGMVNAVLRKVAGVAGVRDGRALPLWESTTAFAERLGHPLWLVERWVQAYGRRAALAICEAGQHEPSHGMLFGLTPVVDARKMAASTSKGDGGDAEEPAPKQLDGGTEWDPNDAESSPGVTAHRHAFDMDDGSRLVAELAAAAMPQAARVWDCCAAPGGKTMVLLERLRGAEILASDVSGRRLKEMEARIARALPAGALLRTRACAAEALPATEGEFDLVLCDVPCTGTGTLARNPEIRHRLRPEDLERQTERQRRILSAALDRVGPGGRLVYSTCSLEPEECEGVVVAVAPGWRRVPIEGLFDRISERLDNVRGGSWPTMIVDDALRTLPGVHPCDGFYAVVLDRPVD